MPVPGIKSTVVDMILNAWSYVDNVIFLYAFFKKIPSIISIRNNNILDSNLIFVDCFLCNKVVRTWVGKITPTIIYVMTMPKGWQYKSSFYDVSYRFAEWSRFAKKNYFCFQSGSYKMLLNMKCCEFHSTLPESGFHSNPSLVMFTNELLKDTYTNKKKKKSFNSFGSKLLLIETWYMIAMDPVKLATLFNWDHLQIPVLILSDFNLDDELLFPSGLKSLENHRLSETF